MNRGSGSLKGGQRNFTRITKPKDVRPGDTMWLPGHIRIVTRVGPGPNNKGIQMLIAESTPNVQTPAAGGKINRIGVDQTIWWFPQSNSFPKSSNEKLAVKKKLNSYNWDSKSTDVWKTPNTAIKEDFIFGRYKPLSKGKTDEN